MKRNECGCGVVDRAGATCTDAFAVADAPSLPPTPSRWVEVTGTSKDPDVAQLLTLNIALVRW